MDETTAMRTGTIRKLFRTEESLFRDHLLRLDAAGRRDRFMGGVADEFLVRYARECFASKSLVLGYFEEDNLRAAGELQAPDDDLTFDIAFSIEPEFRNRGIGTAMLRRLIFSARNRKIQHLRMNCHGQNQRCRRLRANSRLISGLSCRNGRGHHTAGSDAVFRSDEGAG
jgi:ribosomal protein S18 acetylase RimI-like enzyme